MKHRTLPEHRHKYREPYRTTHKQRVEIKAILASHEHVGPLAAAIKSAENAMTSGLATCPVEWVLRGVKKLSGSQGHEATAVNLCDNLPRV